jgi:hypothetical protein
VPRQNEKGPPNRWWAIFDRIDVLAAIEYAAGAALDPNDPLPDTLIANAQALGLMPAELRLWIYDDPHRREWTMEALAQWAERFGLGKFKGAEMEKAAAPPEGASE